ncbi:MAG: family 43 glycosylhydrolase [Muribaculaceae bacterium]
MAAPTDSIRVVKGQVSDYFITVSKQREIHGTVYDAQGNTLEGATVMFHSSPMHSQSDAKGHFCIKGSDNDVRLYVYYPGKKFYDKVLNVADDNISIVMENGNREIPDRSAAKITRWYNAKNPLTNTYCNPVNISYNFEPYNNNIKGGSFRSSADPMGLTYKGDYYIFSTNQGGYNYSKDLTNWTFVPATFQRKPADDDLCAPAAFVSGDTIFYTGSTYEGLPVWYTTNPKGGDFKRYIEKISLPSWDPCLFKDDDNRVYLYYGSSNEYPLKGVEIDTRDFYPISKIKDVMMLHPDEHGWERFGMNNDDTTTLAPFTEGAYMTKHNGKYYLQYGAPGTEFKVYADGVYVGDSPLGPFTYQKHNPMSYKPGGYVQGSGHGGTFADVNGNYWHVSTCMLSIKYKFERRIGIYPTAFDKDGIMYSSSAFGDYPTYSALNDIKNPEKRFANWMLLSYKKNVEASTTDSIYNVNNVCDESMRSYWAAKSGGKDEWLKMDLGEVKTVRAVQINYYEHNATQYNRASDLYYQYRIYHSLDGKNWELVIDKSDNDKDVPHDYVELAEPLRTRYLKFENLHVASGDLAISGFRVFGNADGKIPSEVKKFKVKRDSKDSRNAMLSWNGVAGAYGYNIYYGIEPDKMYNSITVLSETSYDMRGLDKDTTYYFTIEALNETGCSGKTKTIKQ